MLKKTVIILVLLAALVAALWLSGNRAAVDEFALAEKETGGVFESRIIDLGDGVKIHVALAGPEDGEPILLIHGFPEFWYSWRKQMTILAAQGYRVAAPDLRGYNRSSKPKGNDNYAIASYAEDMVRIIDALGWESVNLSGHDVGAGVAWALVFYQPDKVRKAVIFNVAQPAALYEALVEEKAKTTGWYRVFFQLPFLPELSLRAGDWFMLAKSFEAAGPNAFSDADIDVYKSAWARDNAISTMLGFYRASGIQFSRRPEDDAPAMPVMFVYAEDDPYLPIETVEIEKRILGAENVELWPGVSHWVLQQEPERTAALMADFFRPAVEEDAAQSSVDGQEPG